MPQCPHCNQIIASQVTECPHCRRPIYPQHMAGQAQYQSPQPGYSQPQYQQPPQQYPPPQHHPQPQQPAGYPYQQPQHQAPPAQPQYQQPPPQYPPQQGQPQYGQAQPRNEPWLARKAHKIAAIVAGLVVGFFIPVLGIIVGLVVGIVMFQVMNPGRSIAPKPGKEQEFVFRLMAVIGVVLVLMLFVMPVSDEGLYISSYRNPPTYVNYLSILVLEPDSITNNDIQVRSPGLPAIVVPALIIIGIGALMPQSMLDRRKKLFVMLAGLILLTAAPVISHFAVDANGDILYDYNFMFWLVWAGMGMALAAEFLPGKMSPQGAYALMFFLPFAAAFSEGLSGHFTANQETWLGDFESAHHGIAGLLGALLGALGGAQGADELEPPVHILELTYPAGRSPKVFTTGWLFGARCIANAGTEDETDMSDQVQWGGNGTFEPSVGRLSRPSFYNVGYNQIVLSCNIGGKLVTKKFPIQAVSNSLHAAVGHKAQVPADAHGCPACPHTCVGPIISGSPHVLINGMPAARVGDPGQHSACCGPNQFTIAAGSSEVLIDGRRAVKLGDPTQHCGGVGQIIEGAP